MKKLRFDSTLNALIRSATAAFNAGEDLTKVHLKWGVKEDATGPYLEIPETDVSLLTSDEQQKVAQETELESQLLSFDNWEKRVDAVNACRVLVNGSPLEIPDGQGGTLPLRSMIEAWYLLHMTEVNEFIQNGSSAFYDAIKNGDQFWWELQGSTGTVRQQAIAIIEPLVQE